MSTRGRLTRRIAAPAPTVEELRKRAERAELKTRINQLTRIYPDTHATLIGVLIVDHTPTVAKALDSLEAMLRSVLTTPAPTSNPIISAVAGIQARRQTPPAPTVEPSRERDTMTKHPAPRVEFIEPEVAAPHAYPLGRSIIHHDPRNRDFRALVAPPTQTDRPGRAWASTAVFDQIDQNCTAEAAVGLCKTYPHRLAFRDDWPQYDEETERVALYREAQKVDPWPGEAYDGSSTDAPFRVLRDRGQISEWRWLFGEQELWNYVTNYGPACVGTYWYRSMFTPDSKGNLVVDASSGVAGGHAWRIVQAHADRFAYRMVNSWGRSWGQSGRAWVKREDMAALLTADGEAVTIASAP